MLVSFASMSETVLGTTGSSGSPGSSPPSLSAHSESQQSHIELAGDEVPAPELGAKPSLLDQALNQSVTFFCASLKVSPTAACFALKRAMRLSG